MNDFLKQFYDYQEENKNNFSNPSVVQNMFQMISEKFHTIEIVNGTYTGEIIDKPDDMESEEYARYKKFKAEVNAFKAPVNRGWSNPSFKGCKPEIFKYFNYDKIGILTGNHVDTSLKKEVIIGVDIDDLELFRKFKIGFDLKNWLPTFTVKTNQGYHLYYRCPLQMVLHCRRFMKFGVDIRANGGYLIGFSSIHPLSKQYYLIVNGKYSDFLPEAVLDIAPAPDVIINLCLDESATETSEMIEKTISEHEENCNFYIGNNFENNIHEDISGVDSVSLNERNSNYFDALKVNDNLSTTTMPNIITASKIEPLPVNKIEINDAYITKKMKELPNDIQDLIINGKPEDRSSGGMKALVALCQANWSKEEANFVMKNFKVGEKYREKERYKLFDSDWEKAISYVKKNPNKRYSEDLDINFQTTYKGIKINTIKANTKKIDHIIEPFLKNGEKLLICAQSGMYKSQLSMQLCVDLLNPNANLFLDTFKINKNYSPKNILFINGENSSYDLIDKYENSVHGLSEHERTSVEEHLIFLSKDEFTTFYENIDNPKFITGIKDVITENNIEMIVIDNLQSFHENDENDNGKMRRTLNKLDSIINTYDIPLLLVHHTGKSGSPDNYARGAGAIGDYVSQALFINGNDSKLKLHHVKSRNSPKFKPIEIVFDGHRLVSVASNQNNCPNGNSKYNLLIKIMNENNNKFDRKGDLENLFQNELKAIGEPSSQAYVRKIIDAAIRDNIIKISNGQTSNKEVVLVK